MKHPIVTEPIPPGSHLEEELATGRWSRLELACMLKMEESELPDLFAGRTRVDDELAELLAVAVGSSKELWVNLEKAYLVNLCAKEMNETIETRSFPMNEERFLSNANGEALVFFVENNPCFIQVERPKTGEAIVPAVE